MPAPTRPLENKAPFSIFFSVMVVVSFLSVSSSKILNSNVSSRLNLLQMPSFSKCAPPEAAHSEVVTMQVTLS